MPSTLRPLLAIMTAGAALLAGCGADEGASSASGNDRPVVVVTTNILGDVVQNLVGDQIEVITIMPVGSDPHSFQPSAQQVAQIGAADAVIVNGAGFEEGLLDVIESAEVDGVPVFEAISAVTTIQFDESAHDEHDEHDEESDHDEHEHDGLDPHFFTDPARMAVAGDAIVAFLTTRVTGVDAAVLASDAAAYIAQLDSLDADVETTLAAIPSDRRVLVTNHAVFGYFADRYGFEVAGTIVPSGSTADGTDAQTLAELAELIEHEGVPAIFADTSSPSELAATLADEVGQVEVVELFSESLGAEDSAGATYLDMIRTNAERIAAALTG